LNSTLLRASALNLPLARPFTISRGSKTVAANVLIEVERDGVVGLGEAAPNARYAQSQASVLAAFEAFQWPDSPAAPLDPVRVGAAFVAQFPHEVAAQAGLDMALWDWAGKRMRRPVHRMLALEPSVPALSSWSISIDSPQATAERVRECAGWPVLKLKLGGGEEDYRAVKSLRSATDRRFRVDANEAWSAEEAPDKIAWLAERGCELVEQPLPAGQLEAMRRLHERSLLPLVADEDAPDLMALDELVGAFDGVNVKLMKCGGLRAAVEMIHAARARGLSIMLGCMIESSIAISAAAQLAPLAQWLDLDGAALLREDPYEGALVEAGRITLRDWPGLGVRKRGAD
jgi:L-alanine-DL-glutamate epimerase-like enolase superfamily enzyme